MEFKRIWNLKTCITLLLLCIISGLLFYNQQIQNGNYEILMYEEDYDSSTFNILDVNHMYNNLVDGWIDFIDSDDSGSSESQTALDEKLKRYMGDYYQSNIRKEDVSYSVYMVASKLFTNNISYTSGYHAMILQMREQSANLIHVGAFSDKGSYSYNNILKTRYDMKFNENVTVSLGGERAVDSIFQFQLTGVFLLMFMIYILYRFLEDQKLGLVNIIYASRNGRVRLTLRRIGILLSASMFGSVAVNLAIYITSFALYGGAEYLNCSIQSSQTFAYLPFACSRIGYLWINILLYGVSIFIIAVFAWAMLSICSNIATAGAAMLTVGVASYLCHQYIPESATLGVLKYTNLFELLIPGDVTFTYTNVRLWGTVYGRSTIYLITALFIFTSCIGAVIIAAYHRHPIASFSKANAWMNRILITYRKWISKLNPWGIDLYKILVGQRGIIVILIGFVLISRVQIYGTVYYDGTRDIMRNYYANMNGNEMNPSVYDEIAEYENQLEEKRQEYQQIKVKEQQGESVNGSYMKTLAEEITALTEAVNEMKQQADYLLEKKNAGEQVQVISPYAYEGIFDGNMDYSLNMTALYIYIMLIFLINGSIACERKGSMVPIIRSAMNGRKPFIRRKVMVNSVLSILIGGVIYAYYYIRVFHMYDCRNMDSNVHSLMFMEKFPLNITIRQYIILGFITKLLVIWAITMMITLVSLYINEKYTLLVCFILLIPHVFYLLGFTVFQYISVVLPMNDWQFLRISTSGMMYIMLYVMMIGAGIVSMYMVHLTWTRRHL